MTQSSAVAECEDNPLRNETRTNFHALYEMSRTLWTPHLCKKFTTHEPSGLIRKESRRDIELSHNEGGTLRHPEQESSDEWTKELLFLYSEFVSV